MTQSHTVNSEAPLRQDGGEGWEARGVRTLSTSKEKEFVFSVKLSC